MGPRDKSSALDAFREAVARFELVEAPLEWEPEAEERCRRSLEETGLLLLGETHGTCELPGIVLAVARGLGTRGVALEWSPALRPLVERFLAGGELADPGTANFWSGDGRITAGHFALLRELRPAPLVLFSEEVGPTDWSGRDFAMAKRLLADRDGETPTLVVTGNLHAALEPHRHGWPMGYHLVQRLPGLATVSLRVLSGAIANLGVKRIGSAEPPAGGRLRVYLNRGELVLDLPRATPAQVPARSGA
ncbi:MAG TPA: hypothetical protein VGJ25_11770 [Gaiellaceae bacterium]